VDRYSDPRVQDYWDNRNRQLDYLDAADASARHSRIEIDWLRAGGGADDDASPAATAPD
jgi:hypothetical protein